MFFNFPNCTRSNILYCIEIIQLIQWHFYCISYLESWEILWSQYTSCCSTTIPCRHRGSRGRRGGRCKHPNPGDYLEGWTSSHTRGYNKKLPSLIGDCSTDQVKGEIVGRDFQKRNVRETTRRMSKKRMKERKQQGFQNNHRLKRNQHSESCHRLIFNNQDNLKVITEPIL
jgi:hypothetical protein